MVKIIRTGNKRFQPSDLLLLEIRFKSTANRLMREFCEDGPAAYDDEVEKMRRRLIRKLLKKAAKIRKIRKKRGEIA